jgi:hypothetical protein
MKFDFTEYKKIKILRFNYRSQLQKKGGPKASSHIATALKIGSASVLPADRTFFFP